MNGKLILFITRISMGWLMLYAGLVKIFDPEWSATGYLANAKTFGGFYNWFVDPSILPITNILNEWSLTLLGVSLLLGAFVRCSGVLGALLMLLYYFPVLEFPHIPPHSYIIDDHIIYALILLYFAYVGAGEYMGLDGRKKKRKRK